MFTTTKSRNRSHRPFESDIETLCSTLKSKVISRGNLAHVDVSQQLQLIEELSSFNLGKHILRNRGANAFWTDYLIFPPTEPTDLSLSNLERFLLYQSPHVIAQRELFHILQSVLQNSIKDNNKISSIPCGTMRDLLSLDISTTKNLKLVGVDIDPEALSLAHNRSLGVKNHTAQIEFVEQDAWALPFQNEFDIITSIGLNVYESDRFSVIDLYKQFYNSLRPTGKLLTGVLTYPPGFETPSDWKHEAISSDILWLERVLYFDILDLNWKNFRSLEEIQSDFIAAGFSKVDVICDSRCVFPAIIATK